MRKKDPPKAVFQDKRSKGKMSAKKNLTNIRHFSVYHPKFEVNKWWWHLLRLNVLQFDLNCDAHKDVLVSLSVRSIYMIISMHAHSPITQLIRYKVKRNFFILCLFREYTNINSTQISITCVTKKFFIVS